MPDMLFTKCLRFSPVQNWAQVQASVAAGTWDSLPKMRLGGLLPAPLPVQGWGSLLLTQVHFRPWLSCAPHLP